MGIWGIFWSPGLVSPGIPAHNRLSASSHNLLAWRILHSFPYFWILDCNILPDPTKPDNSQNPWVRIACATSRQQLSGNHVVVISRRRILWWYQCLFLTAAVRSDDYIIRSSDKPGWVLTTSFLQKLVGTKHHGQPNGRYWVLGLISLRMPIRTDRLERMVVRHDMNNIQRLSFCRLFFCSAASWQQQNWSHQAHGLEQILFHKRFKWITKVNNHPENLCTDLKMATLINIRIIESLLVFCKFVTLIIHKSFYHEKESW